MPFVYSYRITATSRFTRVIAAAPKAAPVTTLTVGNQGDLALAAALAADGSVVWARRYALAGGSLSLIDAVAVDDGGFVLLASRGRTPDGERYSDFAVLRIDHSGTVVWARPCHGDGSLSLGRVVRRPGAREEFLCVAWQAQAAAGATGGAAVLTVFTGNGTVRISARLILPNRAGRLFDIVATEAGYFLVGDGQTLSPSAPAGWWNKDLMLYEALGAAGLLIRLDGDLQKFQAWLVNSSSEKLRGFSLRAALPTPDGLVVAAAMAPLAPGPSAMVLAALNLSDPAPVASVAHTCPLDDARVLPSRLVKLGDAYLLLNRDRPAASAASATVLHAGADLLVRARYGFDFAAGAAVLDLAAGGATGLGCGVTPTSGGNTDGWLLAADANFSCCRTHPLKTPASADITLVFTPIPTGTKVDAPGAPTVLSVVANSVDAARTSLCGTGLDLSGESLVQSPFLSLHAAGSDGSAGARGVLLRWFFHGTLASHLPKGTLARTTIGFNQPDDFVSIYRAKWPADPPLRRLAFATDQAAYVDDAIRTIYFQTGSATPRDLFAVRCLDAAAYTAAKQAVDPLANAAGFISAYGNHPLEIELRGVLSVACDLGLAAGSGAALKVETVSVGENRPSAERHVTSRRILGAGAAPVARLLAENMCSVRVQPGASQLQSVAFIAYDDILTQLNTREAWYPVDDFALSLDQSRVFCRLENPGLVNVHAVWPKFNGAAFVNVHNYQDRWTAPSVGLASAVQTYVQLSDIDPQAVQQVPGDHPDDGTISLSYLDLLNFAGETDYHVARMLGLGHLDAAVEPATTYVHLCVYRTLGDLQDGSGARPVRHLYMSLPTALADSRLPLVPDLDTIEYGLSVPSGSGLPYALTDAQGYTPDGTARYIKLHPGCRPLYVPEQGFFDPPDLFDLSRSSLPVTYGVEYRALNEAGWRKPEIACDPAYVDTATPPVAEIMTTPFPATQAASGFIHKETESGIHEYAIFGVSLFSQPSALGTPRATDSTVFKRRNTLLPPGDVQTQFIQQESTLVLTTATEQALLAALKQAGADLTLIRVCCNYGMAQETAYGFADTVEIYHRRQIPGNVTGGVQAIGSEDDPALVRIETQPYVFASGQMASPLLPHGMKSHFVGGVLVAGGLRLVIADIQWPVTSSDANPIFLVRKPTTTGAASGASGNTLIVDETPLNIFPGDLCMAIENMADPANWDGDNPLAATIQIGDPTWTVRTESFTRPDGTMVTRRLRGVWSTATVSVAPPPPTSPPAVPDPKLYDVVFDTYMLQPHPQSAAPNPVVWYKGTVRLPVSGADPEDRRTLNIQSTRISSGNQLVLRVRDDSGQPGNLVTGSGCLANYYPGYKTYLHADPAHAFDALNLMPVAGEGSRTSLLGLCSRDSSTLDVQGHAYRSNVSSPQLVAAAEIIEPKPPQRPSGLLYAAPPDSRGRSSYTLDVTFAHEPFAAVFYRADALGILDALYDDASLTAIRAAIFPPERDIWFGNRFTDLFAFLDDARPTLAAFPAPDGFALPVPDAAALGLGSGPLTPSGKAKLKAAVLKAFVPLTEQPLIYAQIRTDPAYLPTNRKQTFRNANGDLLSPGDPAFDLAPMAKRPGPAGTPRVQFTDFTLDGSMNPNTVYFYFARELGNRLQFSDPSPVWGPVKLVNLTPPAAPTLRKISSIPYDPATGANPEVRFEIIAPPSSDPIARLRLYRSTAAADALSLRTMQVLAEVDLATLSITNDGTLIVADNFATDLAAGGFIPYGEPLYYRLAWIREVTYLDASQVLQVASVVSQPTRAFLANIIDVVNPPPPTPTLTLVSFAQNGDRFLSLSWSKTVHNGTYYISQLTPSGNWTRLGVLKSNDLSLAFALPDALPARDDDANLIYYRFKVDVEGPSGLLNTTDSPVTVNLESV